MRYFTPALADRTLPLVRRIAHDLVDLQSDLRLRQSRIDLLTNAEKSPTSTAHAEEMTEMRASLGEDQRRMLALEEELAALGAMIHSPAEGAIDFPAQIGSRRVRLCWRLGEPHVSHWHEVHAPLARRHRIVDENFVAPVSATADA